MTRAIGTRYFQLRGFDAVVRHGSFTQAAARLGLTQPAVTMQVRNLEAACRQSLLNRSPGGRGPSLTPAGEQLFELSRQLFAVEEQVEEFVATASRLGQGSLRLFGDSPRVAMRLVSTFHARYPGIDLSVAFGSQRSGWDALFDQRVDLAILGNTGPHARVHSTPLGAQAMLAVLPRDHPLAGRTQLALAELAGSRLVRREAGSNTQRLADEALAAAGVQLATAFEVGSREAVLEAVKLGLGIGFVLEQEIHRDERLVGIPVAELPACSTDAVVCLHSQRKRGAVQAFLAVAAELAAASDEGRPLPDALP